MRDLTHNIQNWEWTWGHAGVTALNAFGLIPVVGGLRVVGRVSRVVPASEVRRATRATRNIASNAGENTSRLARGLNRGEDVVSNAWSMRKGGDIINGRRYTEHALERMAPNTPSVRAELASRATQRANAQGLQPGTTQYYEFFRKQVDPRGIPPMAVEDVIRNTPAIPGVSPGTFVHQTSDVKIIINSSGDVITVIPQ